MDASNGDSDIVIIVQWFSAPVTSWVRPPESEEFRFSGSFVVKSGLMICHVSPLSTDLKT
jgi:hypothetical protein